MAQHQPLFTTAFLLSVWAKSYETYCSDGSDERLKAKLQHWSDKQFQNETVAEATLVQSFFVEQWGYMASGQQSKALGYTLAPQFAIQQAGQKGGVGKADLAMGWFDHETLPAVPQILCEFKDTRSGLDAKQNRKGNNRSPVQQCADYLTFARREFTPFGHEKIQPTWGIVTDMNEFRLYWSAKMPHQFERFIIRLRNGEQGIALLDNGEAARKQRFLFSQLFHAEQLLNKGTESPLQTLISKQQLQEKALEKTFYFEYRAYRDHLFKTLLASNPSYQTQPKKLVRLTQKLLDRLLFILFCEDMGAHLSYPLNLLRDLMIEYSQDRRYAPNESDIWEEKILRLFKSMREGTPFLKHDINRFNGGLFAADADLDALNIPNKLFFAPMQGASNQALVSHPLTLLYFSANYNFGIEDSGDRAIGLYTLGRIFEQSITDLEIMEAEAANEMSLMKLSKRKTDGVYYTPEWVTAYIVEETLGLRLNEIAEQLGLTRQLPPNEQQIEQDHSKQGKLKKGSTTQAYLDLLIAYETALGQLTVLDPACGSGAFLIQALKRLLQEHERIINEKRRVSYELKQSPMFDKAKIYRDILAKNLYGVDVNPESVEITKLALWLHTVMPGQPLSSLDGNIFCGNSLVDWDIKNTLPDLNESQLDNINPFSYRTAFAKVFSDGGFDVIIGNPPYIKLQNMRSIQPEVTDYWVIAKHPQQPEQPKFLSTQTGNYDIYLPFIEQSTQHLKPTGRMGFIAPNVWTVNDYGQGLRGFLHQHKHLDRWVDFKDYQIFDEAITYTALQFFTGKAQTGIKLHFAPKGQPDLGLLDWANTPELAYADLPQQDAWQFMPAQERAFIQKLNNNCTTLADSCDSISVGIQTSADHIYHLTKVGDNQYLSHAIKGQAIAVTIEDDLMKPLVSGTESKRYQTPMTDTYLLFPYDISGDKPVLFTAEIMASHYPQGWAYLKQHEVALRLREKSKMDKDDNWWAYNYPKNLDKQKLKKLTVPQTVPDLRVTFDDKGDFYLNNVRVNGIFITESELGWFLLGIMNAPVTNFVFKRIAKSKEGGYFEANKQFIAPLPIPKVTDEQKQQVADFAEQLQTHHTNYRDKLIAFDKRLASSQMEDDTKPLTWVWAKLADAKTLKVSAEAKATGLTGKALTEWAKQQAEKIRQQCFEPIASRLAPKAKLHADFTDGELSLHIDKTKVLSVYVDDDEGKRILPQWRQVIRNTNITPSLSAEKFVSLLLALKRTDNTSLLQQIVKLDKELEALAQTIASTEQQLNQLTYQLYGLTEEEIGMVERG